jgi:Malic enzyme, NAD binding domain
MVEASSLGLADSLDNEERDLDLLYPRLDRIREISAFIATRVIRKAQEEVRSGIFVINLNSPRNIRVLTGTVICVPSMILNSCHM